MLCDSSVRMNAPQQFLLCFPSSFLIFILCLCFRYVQYTMPPVSNWSTLYEYSSVHFCWLPIQTLSGISLYLSYLITYHFLLITWSSLHNCVKSALYQVRLAEKEVSTYFSCYPYVFILFWFLPYKYNHLCLFFFPKTLNRYDHLLIIPNASWILSQSMLNPISIPQAAFISKSQLPQLRIWYTALILTWIYCINQTRQV